jgi:hypothetical protein
MHEDKRKKDGLAIRYWPPPPPASAVLWPRSDAREPRPAAGRHGAVARSNRRTRSNAHSSENSVACHMVVNISLKMRAEALPLPAEAPRWPGEESRDKNANRSASRIQMW